MSKYPVVQFVSFVTNLSPDQFIPEWEPYAKRLQYKKQEPELLQLVTIPNNKFRYMSQYKWPDPDFHFSFIHDRKSEHNVRVLQVGGYIPLPAEKRKADKDDDTKLIAFVSHKETDIDAYRRLPLFHQLDIYQAYYESCAYGYVLEFFVPETDADELLRQVQQIPGVEAGIYKECTVTA